VNSHWVLSVSDNGIGMTQKPEHYAQRGFGLSSMRERASAIGGQFQIDSKPGEGTRVSVRLARRRSA
jgi:signal transduction histidine kinase